MAKITKPEVERFETIFFHSGNVEKTERDGKTQTRLLVDLSPEDYKIFKKVIEHFGGRYINRKNGHMFDTPIDATVSSLKFFVENFNEKSQLNEHEFFPTSPEVADKMMEEMVSYDLFSEYLFGNESERGKTSRVIEPSAGQGALIDAFVKKFPDFQGTIVAVEIDPLKCEFLRNKYAESNIPILVVNDDFLSMDTEDLGKFNAVLMNPPFKNWEEHYTKALSVSTSDGWVSCILPDIRANLNNSKSREIVASSNAGVVSISDIEAGAFASSGRGASKRAASHSTNVRTVLVTTSPENLEAESKHVVFNAVLGLENNYNVVTNIAKISDKHIARYKENGLSEEDFVEGIMKEVTDYIESQAPSLVAEGLSISSRNVSQGAAKSLIAYHLESNGHEELEELVVKLAVDPFEPAQKPEQTSEQTLETTPFRP